MSGADDTGSSPSGEDAADAVPPMSVGESPESDSGTITSIEENAHDDFQTGMKALRDQWGYGRAVAKNGSWCFVDLGRFRVSTITDSVKEDTVRIIARVPERFANANAYGFVTIPPLTHCDGNDIQRQHLNHNKSEAVREQWDLDGDEVALWSFNWRDLATNNPECLAKAPSVAKTAIHRAVREAE